MALSPAERVDLATRLLRSAGTEDAVRFVALREDVAAGFGQIDAGEGVEVRQGQLGGFIRGLGGEAVERVARKTA